MAPRSRSSLKAAQQRQSCPLQTIADIQLDSFLVEARSFSPQAAETSLDFCLKVVTRPNCRRNVFFCTCAAYLLSDATAKFRVWHSVKSREWIDPTAAEHLRWSLSGVSLSIQDSSARVSQTCNAMLLHDSYQEVLMILGSECRLTSTGSFERAQNDSTLFCSCLAVCLGQSGKFCSSMLKSAILKARNCVASCSAATNKSSATRVDIVVWHRSIVPARASQAVVAMLVRVSHLRCRDHMVSAKTWSMAS